MVGSDTSDDESLPVGWSEAESMEAMPSTDDARASVLYEREGAEVGLRVFPSEPNVPHADTDRWRVGVVQGSFDNPDRMDPIADVEGRDEALDVARSFMEAYEDAEGAGNRVERAMEVVSR